MFCRKIIDKIRFFIKYIIFKNKYKLDFYINRCENLSKIIKELNIEKRNYIQLENLYNNLNSICINIVDMRVDFFEVNNKLYLYKQILRDNIFFDNEVIMYIYDMHLEYPKNIVCKIVFSISYKNKKIEIDTINTYPDYERLGFATRLLSYLEDYACKNCINEIYGNIEIKSYIGFDNLIKFYEKNGYSIYKTKENNYYFRKIITGQ